MNGPAGLVIAGGASSRFDGEKALARLRGRPLLGWSLAALEAVCGEVAVSARPGGRVWALAASLQRRCLSDAPGHPRGPLAGVASGLAWTRSSGCSSLVTLPVDAPLVGGPQLERLLAAAAGFRAAYAATPGGVHPLCAVWTVELERPLRARLDAGDHPSVQGWLREVGAVRVDFDDDALFRNVNTRADIAFLEGSLAGAPGPDA